MKNSIRNAIYSQIKNFQMKTLITLLFALGGICAFAQDTTYTLDDEYFGWYTNDSKSWIIHNDETDTLHAAVNDDTVVVNLPHRFATYFTSIMEISMDTLALTSDLEGTFEVRTAQCLTCPYTTIETITIPNIGVFTRDTFEVDNIRMQFRIIGTSGDGTIPYWLTLKPKGSW